MASKNTPNSIISAAGWLLQFVTLLIKGLTIRGWDNERIHALVTDRGTADLERIIDALTNALAGPITPLVYFENGPHRFSVGVWNSIEHIIAAGKYGSCDPRVTSARFPITSAGGRLVAVEAMLFHFNRCVSPEGVVRLIEAAGYRPATIEEMLYFGAAFPEVQLEFPVYALGSFTEIDGEGVIPSLDAAGRERRLVLRYHTVPGCRFLAIRK